jgi:hypothetical protein
MSGVGAALIANNELCLIAEQVNDFSFSLIAPLGSYYNSYGHYDSKNGLSY